MKIIGYILMIMAGMVAMINGFKIENIISGIIIIISVFLINWKDL